MRTATKLLVIVNILLTTFIVYDGLHKPKPVKVQQINVDSLRNVIDSLQQESYMWERTADRYDIVMEMFKQEYPKESKKLDECFSHIE